MFPYFAVTRPTLNCLPSEYGTQKVNYHYSHNATKTKEMVFDPRSVGNHKPVSIKGQVVKQVTQFKSLGITLDCKLQWSFHVEYVCSKISQRLYFLRRIRLHGVDK